MGIGTGFRPRAGRSWIQALPSRSGSLPGWSCGDAMHRLIAISSGHLLSPMRGQMMGDRDRGFGTSTARAKTGVGTVLMENTLLDTAFRLVTVYRMQRTP